MFAVVQFTTESTNDNLSVSEVPASWITDDQKQCWWPPRNTGIYIIRQKKPNPDTWKLYPVNVECFCETYQEAKKKVMAITSSDDERSLKPNRKYNPEQFELNFIDETNNNSETLLLPIVPMSMKSVTPSVEESSEDTQSFTTINTERTILDILDCHPNYSPAAPEAEVSVSNQNKENAENSHNCCKNSDIIIQLLTELNIKVAELKEAIVGKTCQGPLHGEQLDLISSKLPCKSIEELEDLEKMILNNQKLNESLICVMSSLGGMTGREFTQRILKKLLTNEVAELCSWTGAKHNFELQKLTILECAYISVTRHYQISRKEFEMHIKDWLRHAKQRKERENMKTNVHSRP